MKTMAVSFIVLILIAFGIGLGIQSCSRFDYSRGNRSGVITKFSERGIVWKTYEGEMVLGGLATGAVSNTWSFSLDKSRARGEDTSNIIKNIEKARVTGARVELKYHETLLRLPWRGKTSYYVYDANIVEG